MRAFGAALAVWVIGRGADSDITGTSLDAQWIVSSTKSPFSAPPMPAEGRTDQLDILTPAAPLPQPSRLGRSTFVALGGALAAVVLGTFLLASARRTATLPPLPLAATVGVVSLTAVDDAAASPEAQAAAAPARPLAPIAPPPASAQAKTLTPPRSDNWGGKGPSKQPARRGALPIAKQPNF